MFISKIFVITSGIYSEPSDIPLHPNFPINNRLHCIIKLKPDYPYSLMAKTIIVIQLSRRRNKHKGK